MTVPQVWARSTRPTWSTTGRGSTRASALLFPNEQAAALHSTVAFFSDLNFFAPASLVNDELHSPGSMREVAGLTVHRDRVSSRRSSAAASSSSAATSSSAACCPRSQQQEECSGSHPGHRSPPLKSPGLQQENNHDHSREPEQQPIRTNGGRIDAARWRSGRSCMEHGMHHHADARAVNSRRERILAERAGNRRLRWTGVARESRGCAIGGADGTHGYCVSRRLA